MIDVLVVGTGGLAREFASYFSACVNVVGFSSTNHVEHEEFKLPGVLFKDDIGRLSPEQVGTENAVIAIAAPLAKRRNFEVLKARGFSFPSLIHPASLVSDLAIVGEGVVVSPHCVVSPNVTLKTLAYLNFSCGVGHDATVGSFVQINPGAQLGGFVRVGDCTLVGSGATVLERVHLGRQVTIASGAVVFARVGDGATMMGNPAKRMRALEK